MAIGSNGALAGLSRAGEDEKGVCSVALSAVVDNEMMGKPEYNSFPGYGAHKRINIPALGLSIMLVGGLMTAFVALGVIPVRKLEHQTITVELSMEPAAPPPPASPPDPAPAKPDAPPTPAPPTPVVAPLPLVAIPAPPQQIVTSSLSVPPVDGAPSPAASAAEARPVAVAPSVASVGDMSSAMEQAVPPVYPVESRRKREEGTVVLEVLLGLDGQVTDISISSSSGYSRLDQAALRAVRRWRWSPTRRDGQAVMVRGLVKIPFILQGKGRDGGRKRHGRHPAAPPVAEEANWSV